MAVMPQDTMIMSSGSESPEETTMMQTQAPKRTADVAGLKPGMRSAKSVKRRASKACQCCRARKVRCNVVEHGAPCTNCRLDEVECIVSESKRKKKWPTNENGDAVQDGKNGMYSAADDSPFPMSACPPYEPLKRTSEHHPHAIYGDLGRDSSVSNGASRSSLYTPNMLMNLQRLSQKPGSISDPSHMLGGLVSPITSSYSLPHYVKPLPGRLSLDDIMYLEKKGALAIPSTPLRNELLRCYAEFVHPYMPLLNLHKVVDIIDRSDGSQAVSLLLFQAMMFAGVGTADMRYLKDAGYETRRDARRDFFAKTRLLYDFDIEVDRISLIQSLLLMTYWYETPDDQKDSHHWMGIAVSLSHTIGLHRNPEKSASMDLPRQKLWKRIWWSTYMRDRLVALGMRRPTRIKDADFDVPMLTLDDFEFDVLDEDITCIPARCQYMRDAEKQRQMAVMCIEKAKLCICISHILSVQYSVLHNNHGATSEEGSTRTTMMLVAKKMEPELNEVQACDRELQRWHNNLAPEAQYVEPVWSDMPDSACLVLNRSLLHLIYYAALSALHRPQVLPSSAMPPRTTQADQLDVSRKAVRLAAGQITSIANTLYTLDAVRYLPTTGITVLLPAIIIHLLDIKAPDDPTRRSSLQGFCQCMQIMAQLRDIYAAADYSTAFLEAAIRKAEISLPRGDVGSFITSSQGLMEAGRRLATPPPEEEMTDAEVAARLNTFLAAAGPTEGFGGLGMDEDGGAVEFDDLVDLDAEPCWGGGESGGFAMEMDIEWMKGVKEGGLAIPV